MSPDLEAIVRSPALDRRRAKRIAAASRTESPARFFPETRLFGRSALLVTRAAHEDLAQDARPGALFWSMTEHGRERLALALEWLFEQLPEELTVEASWGERLQAEKLVSRPELARIVRAGQLEQRVRYRLLPD
ncbi:MAG: hypothetical protein E6G45_14110 [Actinobacteria bacterium]|nr:MAG: hypothetical protein E6G45_14110 [Actinomycetota bacterium]